MKILISFCNQAEESDKNNLMIYDLDNNSEEYLINSGESFTGLAQDDLYYYAITQGAPGRLIILDKCNHLIICEQTLGQTSDPHSMIVVDKYIFIVSTGTDSVIKYKFDDKKVEVNFIEVIWKIEDSENSDTEHVNSIFRHKNDIFISAFGPKNGLKWSSANNGYIYNVTKKKKVLTNINHPHALFVKDDEIYYCESATGDIKRNKDVLIHSEGDYARGLDLLGKYLAFGVSGGRKLSKSTGLKNDIAETSMHNANCKIKIYKKKFFSRKFHIFSEIDIFPHHVEIYDVLFVK